MIKYSDMIKYSGIKEGGKLRVVGESAPGFAELGGIVTVTEVIGYRADVVDAKGHQAHFLYACGAARLEKIEN